MGVEVNELGIVKGCTVYVIGKTIVLGTELLRHLSFEQRQAVVAHEPYHIKKKHRLLNVFSLLLILGIAYLCFSNFYVLPFLMKSLTSVILAVTVNIAQLVFVMTAFYTY